MQHRIPRRSAHTILLTAAAAAAAVTTAATALGATPAHATPTRPVTTARTSTTATCSQAYLPLPDPSCTPGALNPDVTQDTIDSTICVSGWTSTVRPPTSYTNPLKVQQIAEYGYSDTSTADYEEDHFVPLELGGAPRDPANLWPEPRNAPSGDTATSKDGVETKLKNLVCSGQVQLADAQTALIDDWQTAVAAVTGTG